MFKITDFRRINFAQLYDQKVFTETGADLRQKERTEKMALAKAARAEQLKSFRELAGTRYERAQILIELRISQGEDVTLDRIFTELTMASKEEEEALIKQVKQLSTNGHPPGRP